MEETIKIFWAHVPKRKIKLAICSKHRAACIAESTDSPSRKNPVIRGRVIRQEFGVFPLTREKDPDKCAYLIWVENKEGMSKEDLIILLAAMSDWLGEELGKTLLDEQSHWDSEMEAYFKGIIFEKILKILDLNLDIKETFAKVSDMPLEFPVVNLEISETPKKMKLSPDEHGVLPGGLCGVNSDREWCIWVQSSEKSPLLSVLFHETLHLRRRVLQSVHYLKKDEDGDYEYTAPPKMLSMIYMDIFKKVIKKLI